MTNHEDFNLESLEFEKYIREMESEETKNEKRIQDLVDDYVSKNLNLTEPEAKKVKEEVTKFYFSGLSLKTIKIEKENQIQRLKNKIQAEETEILSDIMELKRLIEKEELRHEEMFSRNGKLNSLLKRKQKLIFKLQQDGNYGTARSHLGIVTNILELREKRCRQIADVLKRIENLNKLLKDNQKQVKELQSISIELNTHPTYSRIMKEYNLRMKQIRRMQKEPYKSILLEIDKTIVKVKGKAERRKV